MVALESDIGDVQGGTTQEGIHLGVMAGTLDLVQRAYLGTEIRDDVLTFNPVMIDRLDGLRLAMQFRRAHITVSLSGAKLTVTALADGYRATINVGVGDTVRELRGGESATFTVGDAGPTGGQARRDSEAHGPGSRRRSSISTECSSIRRTRQHGGRRYAS